MDTILGWLKEHVSKKEWGHIKSAPFAVTLLLTLGIVIGWTVKSVLWSASDAAKEATIQQLIAAGTKTQNSKTLKRRATILSRQVFNYSQAWETGEKSNNRGLYGSDYINRFGLRVVKMREELDEEGQQSDALDELINHFTATYSNTIIIAREIQKLADKLTD